MFDAWSSVRNTLLRAKVLRNLPECVQHGLVGTITDGVDVLRGEHNIILSECHISVLVELTTPHPLSHHSRTSLFRSSSGMRINPRASGLSE